jgi:small subunit ribosomal protein S16
MPVVIRLARGGKKHQPIYSVVVADEDHPRDGRFTEKLGTYNPKLEPKPLLLNRDRYQHWVGKGAKPSETVTSLVKRYASS